MLKGAFESIYIFFVLMLYGYFYEELTGKEYGLRDQDQN